MSILVNTHNEFEEKVLIAFLDSLKFDYKSNSSDETPTAAFLDQYNAEIDQANAEIDAGDFVTHNEVEQLFANRRKRLNGN